MVLLGAVIERENISGAFCISTSNEYICVYIVT